MASRPSVDSVCSSVPFTQVELVFGSFRVGVPMIV